MAEKIYSIYLHIPFCENKCPYCDFYSIAQTSDEIKLQYTQALQTELGYYSKNISSNLNSVFFGGGSPIVLGIKNLEKILKKLQKNFDNKTEVSIEINPEHINQDLIKDLLTLGINRFSVGMQTTSEQILCLIERTKNVCYKDIQKNIDTILNLHKNNLFKLSFDFMFGLPEQTLELFEQDLKFIKNAEPDHVSLYLFTVMENYKLLKKCPSDEQIRKMFLMSQQKLKKTNYYQYEVSNFAKQNSNNICVHNMNYWTRQSYLGLGASAHSFFKKSQSRAWHKKDVLSYIKSPTKHEDSEQLDEEKIREEKIMLGLRLLKTGIHKSLINENIYTPLLEKNFILEANNYLFIQPDKVCNIDSIILELLRN